MNSAGRDWLKLVAGVTVGLIVGFVFIVWLISQFIGAARAFDDGRHAQSPDHDWINSLKNKLGGVCCSLADGYSIDDPDWGRDADGYWVAVNGERISVPDNSLVTVPNKRGRAMVWPVIGADRKVSIRCFMPGAET